MDLRKQLAEPSGFLTKWLVRRSAYALLCAFMSALVCWMTAHYGLGHRSEWVGALAVGVSVLVVIHLGFAMGRKASTAMLDCISAQIEGEAGRFSIPPLQSLGWAPLVRLDVAIQSLVRQQSDQYHAVQAELAKYRMLADEAPGLEVCFTPDGVVQWMNHDARQKFGSEGLPATVSELVDAWVYPKDRVMLREHIDKAIQGLLRDQVEVRLLHAGNPFTWGLCRLMPSVAGEGEVLGVRLSVQDIQSRKEAETRLIEMVAALQRAQALKEHYLGRSNDERMRLSALLDIVKFGILFVDRDRRVTYINQAAADMWGLENRDEISGMRDTAVMELSTALRIDDAAYREHLSEVVARNLRSEPYDVKFRDGRVVREQSTPVPSSDGRQSIGRVWIFEDVTEALQTQNRLIELAECDPLTGLFNRRRFHDELDRQFADAMRRGTRLGLVSFDLDRFKEINDRYGHQAGDEVLLKVTEELRTVIRRNEMIFRLGGDEFAILVPHARRESVQRLAQRVVEKAAGIPFRFADQPVCVTLSLGMAFAPDHANDTESLVNAADRALYRAKAEGKNRWQAAEERAWDPVDTLAKTSLTPDLFTSSP